MKFEIIIDTDEKQIDILYAGYNIISETIYNDKMPDRIVKLLETRQKRDQRTSQDRQRGGSNHNGILKGGDFMIYMHDLQRETLKEADNLINEGKSYEEILHHFFDKKYCLRVPHGANGQPLKTIVKLYKDGAQWSKGDRIMAHAPCVGWRIIKKMPI